MRKLKLTNPRYKQLLQGFENWLLTMGYSSKTIYSQGSYAKGFLFFQQEKNRSFTVLQSVHYKEYMQQSRTRKNSQKAGALSSSSLNHIAQSLENFQKYLLQTNQASSFQALNREQVEVRTILTFTKEEIQDLYQACTTTFIGLRNKAVLGLCYGCGLRAGEACSLQLDNIWWDKQLLQVRKSKTKTSRLVPMTAKVQEDLKDYLQLARPLVPRSSQSSHFLLTARGNPTKHRVLYKSFQKLLQEQDLTQTGLHTLRHSIASHLSQAGMSSEQVAQFLGHQTLNSTQLYVHKK